MMNKKFTAAAVATLLVAGLTACAPGSAGEGAAAPTKLTVSTWTANEPGLKDWWPELVAGFEAEHEGVTVDVQQIAFADYQQQITTQLTAGAAPEVLHVPTPTTMLPAWAEAGFLLDMDEFLAGTDILDEWPATQDVMAWDGTNYGVLLVDYGYVLFYNEAILAEAGVAVPESPEELLAAAEKITALGDAYKPFAITADNSANFIRDALVFATGMGAEWVADGEWNLTDPAVVEAFELWRTMGRDFSPQGTDIGQKREAFLTGNVAMMIEGPFYQATVKGTADPSLVDSFKIGKTPFEVNPGDVSHGLAVPEGLDDATEALALEFVQYASSAEMMSSYSELVTSPVARPGASDALLENPETAVIAEVAADKTPIIDPSLYGLRANYFDFTEIAGASLHRLLASDEDTAAVLKSLQSELEKAAIKP